MENRKNFIIVFLVVLIFLFYSCTLDQEENLSDGWVYVKEKDFATALKKFRFDYEKFQDSLDIVVGMFYVHFVYGQDDSTKKYLSKSFEISENDDKNLFIGSLYYREKNYDSCNFFYEKYVEKNSPFYNPYLISTVIKSNSFHKIGLSCEFLTKNYQFAYDVLKTITNISDSLDINKDEDRMIIFDYINKLEE
jgi:tetratricopeptide (TPR) repeat protein